jgi:hypothetical protein
MHRTSGMDMPEAPITHHWLDSTHITFGVLTGGVVLGDVKLEASAFNGREPDESRGGFDLAPLDSLSGRVTLRPRDTLELQASAGRLESAEQDFAGGTRYDITRVTASASYTQGRLAATLAWGANTERGQTTHAGLAEASVSMTSRDVLFARAELNGKPSHALHIHEQPGAILTVGKLPSGYVRYAPPSHHVQIGVGGSVSAALVPRSIQPNYGGVGFGLGIFTSVRPATH